MQIEVHASDWEKIQQQLWDMKLKLPQICELFYCTYIALYLLHLSFLDMVNKWLSVQARISGSSGPLKSVCVLRNSEKYC